MLREVLLVIFNLNIFVYGTVTDDVVKWNITPLQYASSGFDIAKPAVAVLDKPLKIILENYYTSEISCRNNNANEFRTTWERKDNLWTTVIKIEQTSKEMNTLWRCTMKKNDSNFQIITFKVRIMGLEEVKMSVGRSELHWRMTNSSALYYDGSTRYSYIDGEVVDLICRSDKSEGHLRLRYYNANGKLLIETDPIATNDIAEFRKIMTFKHNGAKIDCTYISEYKLEYTYRLIFRLKTATDDYKININGLKLVSTEPENPESVEEYYLYKFYKGQKVSVSCAMSKRLTSNLSLHFDDPTMNAILPDTKHKWKRIITLNTDNLNQKHLKCSNEKTPFIADILFLSETIDPFIMGLIVSDIIHQYRKNSSTWVIDYHYTVNQTLKCLAEEYSFYWWPFKSTNLPSGSVTLRDEYNGSSIICETHKKPISRRTIVNLFRKLETNSGSGLARELSTDYSNIWMIGCTVLVSAMAIVLLSTIIWCRLSRSRATRENSCTNLTRDFETPIPRYPNQWANTSTSLPEGTMVNNQLYTGEKLAIRTKRKKSDDHVYHYPVASCNDSITGDTKLDDNKTNMTRGSGEEYSNVRTNSSAGEDESQLSTENKSFADILDSIVRIKRTSEYVEPAYSVVHLTD